MQINYNLTTNGWFYDVTLGEVMHSIQVQAAASAKRVLESSNCSVHSQRFGESGV